MYLNSVPRTAGDSAILISPDFDISSKFAEISFRTQCTVSIGTLNVAISDGELLNNVWSKSGDQGINGLKRSFNLLD